MTTLFKKNHIWLYRQFLQNCHPAAVQPGLLHYVRNDAMQRNFLAMTRCDEIFYYGNYP
jgi:hypothetical protein